MFFAYIFSPLTHAILLHIGGKKLHLTQKCDVLYCQRLLLF